MGIEDILGMATNTVGGGVVNLGADIINGLIRQGRMADAREYINSMPIPDIDKMSYNAVLVNDPQQLVNMVQADTRLSQIQEDPRLRNTQMEALGQLQERGRDGYTVQEKAQMQATMNDALNRQKGANMASESQMARRGISGSGIDIASQLSRNQAGIGAASQAGLDIASQGQQRALQAMQGAGQLAGQTRSQDWGQKAQVGSAQDAINAANNRNAMTTQQFNIGNKMATDQYNANAGTASAKSKADAEIAKAQMERDKNLAMANTYM